MTTTESDGILMEWFMLLSLIARGMVYVVVTDCQRNGLCCCHWLPEEWFMLLSLIARGMVYVIVTGCQRNGLCSCH
jgi:uncharacterized protein YodC (DUF2158 family)